VSIDDGEIIRRSLVQRAAFAELYDRHERTVFRYAARRLGPFEADDIASETFLVAFTRRADFDGGADARPWLLGIATVLIHKLARLEAKAWRGMHAADLARVDMDEYSVVDARLDAKRLARRMGKTLARLPAGDRDALLLYTFGDLDYEGVSRALGIPVGTVRSRLNRARRKLRAALNITVGQEETEEPHGRDLRPAAVTD
jgi:RNA polymerase sigma factor (sigma-70 family)